MRGGVAAELGEALRRPDASAVRRITGYSIGGIPPFGHARHAPALFDERLLDFDTVWAAAGTPRCVFPVSPRRLQTAIGARPFRYAHRNDRFGLCRPRLGGVLRRFRARGDCIDKDAAKIEALGRAKMPIFEPGLEELVARNVAQGRLSFDLDLAAAVRAAQAVFIARRHALAARRRPCGPLLSSIRRPARSRRRSTASP
jgi:hypothetical protein